MKPYMLKTSVIWERRQKNEDQGEDIFAATSDASPSVLIVC